MHIAGTFAALGGVDWDPTQGTMTRVDATHWSLTLTGKEGTQVQYKYVLGDWNYVEKGPVPDCAELDNRETTLDVRLERDADRVRHRRQLAQRRALRELGEKRGHRPRPGNAGARARLPQAVPGCSGASPAASRSITSLTFASSVSSCCS